MTVDRPEGPPHGGTAGLDANGLPLGLQVIGKALDEATVFQVGAALEQAAGSVGKPERWW